MNPRNPNIRRDTKGINFLKSVTKLLKHACKNGETIIENNEGDKMDKMVYDLLSTTGIRLANITPNSYIYVRYFGEQKKADLFILDWKLTISDKNKVLIINAKHSHSDGSSIIDINDLCKLEAIENNQDDYRKTPINGAFQKCLPYVLLDSFFAFVIRHRIVETFFKKIGKKNENDHLKIIPKSKYLFPFEFIIGNQSWLFYSEQNKNRPQVYFGLNNERCVSVSETVAKKDSEHFILISFNKQEPFMFYKVTWKNIYKLLPEYLEDKKISWFYQDIDLYKYRRFAINGATQIEKISPSSQSLADFVDIGAKGAIENNDIFFSTKSQVNDPFDFDIRRPLHLAKSIDKKTIEARSYLPQKEDNDVIFCATKRSDNILMWSHYADSHKGMCFGYRYSKILNAIDSETTCKICVFGDVNYSKDRPAFKFAYLMAKYLYIDVVIWLFNIKSLFTKFEDWSYEKECRFIMVPFNKKDYENGKIP